MHNTIGNVAGMNIRRETNHFYGFQVQYSKNRFSLSSCSLVWGIFQLHVLKRKFWKEEGVYTLFFIRTILYKNKEAQICPKIKNN